MLRYSNEKNKEGSHVMTKIKCSVTTLLASKLVIALVQRGSLLEEGEVYHMGLTRTI
jgi:hypothetical protein